MPASIIPLTVKILTTIFVECRVLGMCHVAERMDSHLCTTFQEGIVLGVVTRNLRRSGLERPRDTIIPPNSPLTDEEAETQMVSNFPKVAELTCRGA